MLSPEQASSLTQALDNERDISIADKASAMDIDMPDAVTPPTEHLSTIPKADLTKRTTMIIGAGAIGLSVARELALINKADKVEQHQIVVVDIMAKEFTQFSGHNPGVLSLRDLPQGMMSLGQLAKSEWSKLVQKPCFASAARYEANGVYEVLTHDSAVALGASKQSPNADWFRGKVDWEYLEQDESFGTM